MITLLLISVIGSSLLKGFLDKSSENRFKNNWWNKGKSWRNKWKATTRPNGWKDLILDENKNRIEKFWGSSRWFVFVTDGWHLIQFVMYRFVDLAVLVAVSPLVTDWWVYPILELILFIVRGIFFEMTHRGYAQRKV